MELTEAQRRAVETVGKNLCVSAGAGSGKTRVLVERFVHLVREHRISPARILAITFTEKAANEMKRRIVARLREEGLEEARREVENASISTIHAFAARLLREHPLEAGVDPHFVILEAEESALLKESALDETIESLVTEPEVFQLLRVFGEERVRRGILESYRRSRDTELSFEDFLRRRSPGERSFFESRVKEGLKKISDVNGAREILEEFPETLDALAGLKGKLRAAGKQKEEIRKVQEALLDLERFLREEETLPARGVFIRLALEFETRYEAAKRIERALDFDDLQLQAVKLLGADAPVNQALRRIYQEKFREILVDEFQDTNRLQDRLLELIRREANLFVVGDFKQSVYGFRGTRVEIFLEKEKAFGESPQGARIPLTENHRSRPRVIEFINRFFKILWQEDGLPFEPLQAVREETGARPRIERIRLEKGEGEDLDEVRIREARSLAGRLRALVDKEGFHYQDIACLFEAMTSVHFYEQEFRRAGIPYFVVSNRDFYAQPEVRDVVSFLSALENPKRDIPLAASLRSPLFQVTDDTLFWLARSAKGEKRGAPLIEGLLAFESIAEIPASEKEKLRFFQSTFERLLAERERLRLSGLVEKLLRLTGYDLYVLKLRPGERRCANLRKLVEIAREMESKETLHLGDFVRAVKGMETREARVSQAQVEAEEGDVVRLMTIHLAKGLEFPVVVLPDLGRGDKREGNPFSVSAEEGLGMEETLTWHRNKEREERLRAEESKRLLYVGMTRAEEKLVLCGPANEKDSTWAAWVERILGEGEWEVQAIGEAPPEPFPFEKQKALAERKAIRTKLENLTAFRLREIPEEVPLLFEKVTPPAKVDFERLDLPVSAFLLFAHDPEAYFKTYEIGVPSEEGPRFLEAKEEEPRGEEGISRAEFGTRVHQILEQALLRRSSIADAERLVSRFAQDLREKEKEEIVRIVLRFLRGEQAREILEARAFYPELPFVLRLPHGIVQGKLDLLYENRKGEWTVLDYKTSDIDEKTLGERGEEYRIQMELYALAVSQILGRLPAEARVHFLRPGRAHPIPFSPADGARLFEKFGALQREILAFRRGKTRDGSL